ncbi:MAG: hypothetical protein J0J06_13895 [Sphingomonas sp.]|uniref:Qat anti-phage system QueC-like protein QatC n=1 Tax=Sphingomonas sp. TaxID=28214 RepID=UPI001AC43B20|nr:Qat anti-phage system QueC-like protein QatC [Sphingomonas sp.]MBN8816527.1 hypothetical protein [Sphingomonas sp.]
MNRHVIIGRFGDEDRQRVPSARDEVVTSLQLAAGKTIRYGIGHALNDLRALGLVPSDIGIDFMVLAAHVHAADTRLSRASESQDGWTREIRLVVPVSDPARWTAAAEIVRRALDFLTGDRWTIGFRARPKPFQDIALPLPPALLDSPYDGISLFSGGLDSLIGAIDRLEDSKTPLLVSHAAEGAVSKSQDDCYKALKQAYNANPFERLRVWMSFDGNLVDGVAAEHTTRGRSFLFFALGVCAGTALGKPFTLQVPENGLIALNVPLDPLRLGALSTRTTHPFHIARWNELLGAIGVPGKLHNPYWDKTKGEMVGGCANQALLDSISAASLSCSSPAKARWQGLPQGHCGYCLPCLIRRASLFGRDKTTYSLLDLNARKLDTGQAEGQQVRSFQIAIDRLAKRPELASLLIHKSGSLRDVAANVDALAGVYGRGLAEVGRLLAGVTAGPR